jgi:heme/copper-type cytochrome/quinol oxidase subunit 2
MNNKNTWLLVALLIVLTILVILVGRSLRRPPAPVSVVNSPAVTTPTTTAPVYVATTTDQFKAAVPPNTKVPSAGEVLSADQQKIIAVPTTVVAAAPGATSQFRTFNITASGGLFTPSKIIANLGDTLHINFTAVDADYDITFPSYGMQQTAKKGETKVLEFLAQADGQFLYYCQSCGGPTSTAKGNIIIVKP